ncbi:DUF1045 domain-containing protein [Methylobacterium nigriterrae]|uniref:DUF1045 domain-containing protein n=1 Tax=Methylobacterium nigriterrae TaxID=3127512 RepID=UPI003013A0B9
MSSTVRYALYFTPAPGSALARFGAGVLGDGPPPDCVVAAGAALAAVTAEPRTYGFHATLKAPMRLAAGIGEDALVRACAALTEHRRPLPAGRLQVALLGSFVALVPEAPVPDVDLFAAECVAALDVLRAPLTEAERARRRPDRLDPRGRALLDRWGYPHVFEAFRFHMTLTGSLAAEERELWLARMARAYDAEASVVIDAVTVMRQEGGEPFRILQRIPFAP